jgi:uncharacterized membrane protein (UPF0127 family)
MRQLEFYILHSIYMILRVPENESEMGCGLSGVKNLPDNFGMLFYQPGKVFDLTTKGMLMSIDVLWFAGSNFDTLVALDEKVLANKIVHAKTSTCIEVAGGWYERNRHLITRGLGAF